MCAFQIYSWWVGLCDIAHHAMEIENEFFNLHSSGQGLVLLMEKTWIDRDFSFIAWVFLIN
jgi:hypothetical protein